MVPRAGLEPARPSTAHFKCDVSTNFTTEAGVKHAIKHQKHVKINGLDAEKECGRGCESQFY